MPGAPTAIGPSAVQVQQAIPLATLGAWSSGVRPRAPSVQGPGTGVEADSAEVVVEQHLPARRSAGTHRSYTTSAKVSLDGTISRVDGLSKHH